MANSRFEYVRAFEAPDALLPNTWIVVRLDGRSFHRLSAARNFTKPNDARALRLMNRAAEGVLRDVADVVLAYGQSDEFSFVFPPETTLFDRRAAKLVTTVVSTFSVYYTLYWSAFFPEQPLVHSAAGDMPTEATLDVESVLPTGPLATFDGRAVVYPSRQNMRDYLAWRQADCHINNLYNTTFWSLVQQAGMTAHEAERRLAGTVAGDKNEILFAQFGINYNNEPEMFRKGSVVFREYTDLADTNATVTAADKPQSATQKDKARKRRAKAKIVTEHVDIIDDAFWNARPWLLSPQT